MNDSYQPIYDAACQALRGADSAVKDAASEAMRNVDGAIREAVSQGIDMHQLMQAMREIPDYESSRPSVLYRPRVFRDGDKWCALYGADIMAGIVGYGDSPEKACEEFDKAWREKPATNDLPWPKRGPSLAQLVTEYVAELKAHGEAFGDDDVPHAHAHEKSCQWDDEKLGECKLCSAWLRMVVVAVAATA